MKEVQQFSQASPDHTFWLATFCIAQGKRGCPGKANQVMNAGTQSNPCRCPLPSPLCPMESLSVLMEGFLTSEGPYGLGDRFLDTMPSWIRFITPTEVTVTMRLSSTDAAPRRRGPALPSRRPAALRIVVTVPRASSAPSVALSGGPHFCDRPGRWVPVWSCGCAFCFQSFSASIKRQNKASYSTCPEGSISQEVPRTTYMETI